MGLSYQQRSHYTVRPNEESVTTLSSALGETPEVESPEDAEEVILGKRWKRGVVKPSAEEVRRHMISHQPFRSWCEFCVKGKAKDSPHYKVHREDWEEEPVYIWD